jgi:hypothetical protein
MLLSVAIAVIWTATAQAAAPGQYKMLLCAGNVGSNAYGTSTNTTSPQNPGGIFSFENYCGPAPDPAGNSAFLRIDENQAAGSAGNGAYGFIYWDTPPYVHYKTAGGWTRQPNAFNEGWRARFWGVDFNNNGFQILSQGLGSGTTSTFAPHLWPGGNADFWRFAYELECVRPAGCDRTNFNATDANTFVFTLADDQSAQVGLTAGSALMQGGWVKGSQAVTWNAADNGSGLRWERVRVDGTERSTIDHRAECNLDASQSNGEYARVFQPCPTGGPYGRSYTFDTASLNDGPHTVQACDQDYGQAVGLNGTGSESCDQRTVYTDNTAPGAPAGLHIVSSNPARYLSNVAAIYSLPSNSGSPIVKVHYDVVDAAGKVVVPEKVASGTNPTELPEVEAPAAPGDYRLRVWLEDAVGFTGPAAAVAIPRDTTPPAAPQDLSVTAPRTVRSAQGFDVRWRNIIDAGSPISAVHYSVLNGAGEAVVPTKTISANNPQAIEALETPHDRGDYTLSLWLEDAEGNVGAPSEAPLSYDCEKSGVGGGLTLTAGIGKHGDGELVVGQKEGSTLSGKLQGLGGQLANAPLCVFSRVVTDQSPTFLGIAMTGAGGEYQFAIGDGPSRDLEVVYRPDQRELAAHATLRTRVRPTFKPKEKVVQNGGYAEFKGAIPGPHAEKVIVVLQVKSGKGWRVFRRYETRKGGEYVMRYRFTQTRSATTYIMRAQVREQSGYPYEEGNSLSVPLRVEP